MGIFGSVYSRMAGLRDAADDGAMSNHAACPAPYESMKERSLATVLMRMSRPSRMSGIRFLSFNARTPN